MTAYLAPADGVRLNVLLGVLEALVLEQLQQCSVGQPQSSELVAVALERRQLAEEAAAATEVDVNLLIQWNFHLVTEQEVWVAGPRETAVAVGAEALHRYSEVVMAVQEPQQVAVAGTGAAEVVHLKMSAAVMMGQVMVLQRGPRCVTVTLGLQLASAPAVPVLRTQSDSAVVKPAEVVVHGSQAHYRASVMRVAGRQPI
jgi:hypothetical protein